MDEVSLRDYVDVRYDELRRRLDESAVDRDRIREGIGNRVSRVEYDVLSERVGKLETQISRLYGGLAVIGLVLASIGILLKYVLG